MGRRKKEKSLRKKPLEHEDYGNEELTLDVPVTLDVPALDVPVTLDDNPDFVNMDDKSPKKTKRKRKKRKSQAVAQESNLESKSKSNKKKKKKKKKRKFQQENTQSTSPIVQTLEQKLIPSLEMLRLSSDSSTNNEMEKIDLTNKAKKILGIPIRVHLNDAPATETSQTPTVLHISSIDELDNRRVQVGQLVSSLQNSYDNYNRALTRNKNVKESVYIPNEVESHVGEIRELILDATSLNDVPLEHLNYLRDTVTEHVDFLDKETAKLNALIDANPNNHQIVSAPSPSPNVQPNVEYPILEVTDNSDTSIRQEIYEKVKLNIQRIEGTYTQYNDLVASVSNSHPPIVIPDELHDRVEQAMAEVLQITKFGNDSTVKTVEKIRCDLLKREIVIMNACDDIHQIIHNMADKAANCPKESRQKVSEGGFVPRPGREPVYPACGQDKKPFSYDYFEEEKNSWRKKLEPCIESLNNDSSSPPFSLLQNALDYLVRDTDVSEAESRLSNLPGFVLDRLIEEHKKMVSALLNNDEIQSQVDGSHSQNILSDLELYEVLHKILLNAKMSQSRNPPVIAIPRIEQIDIPAKKESESSQKNTHRGKGHEIKKLNQRLLERFERNTDPQKVSEDEFRGRYAKCIHLFSNDKTMVKFKRSDFPENSTPFTKILEKQAVFPDTLEDYLKDTKLFKEGFYRLEVPFTTDALLLIQRFFQWRTQYRNMTIDVPQFLFPNNIQIIMEIIMFCHFFNID